MVPAIQLPQLPSLYAPSAIRYYASPMLDSIRSFFRQEIEAPTPAPATAGESTDSPNLALAACALMLEIAYADDEFADSERSHVEGVLARHFELPQEKIAELVELAEKERRQAVDLFQFTQLIADSYDEAQKMVLAEALWGLVFADGEVAAHETYLMRKMSHLLGIEPGFLAEARKRAEEGEEGSSR
ncbi:MAG: TerB family tellurite resistance protein [Gemmatimonadales bacterium]